MGLLGTPVPSCALTTRPGAGDLPRFAAGPTAALSFSRFAFSSSISRRWSAVGGSAPPPAIPLEGGTIHDDIDELDVLITGIGCIIGGGPEGVGNIGGVVVIPVVTATASVSSSFAEALGPRLEPLDPVVTGVSPIREFGLLCCTPSL